MTFGSAIKTLHCNGHCDLYNFLVTISYSLITFCDLTLPVLQVELLILSVWQTFSLLFYLVLCLPCFFLFDSDLSAVS